MRRGERRAAHVTVRSFGPLRIAARQATIRVAGSIRVLPPFHSRKHLPSRLARLRELDGRTSVMVRGQGTEFDSLREYVRGDDVRSLDWRATARRRDPASGGVKLVVRTWRPERDRRVVLVVDSGRTSAARIADEPRIDTAFEASLLLAALASRAGDRVDLLDLRPSRARTRAGRHRRRPARPHGRHDGADRARADRIRLEHRARPGAPGHRRSARSSCCSPRSTPRAPRAACCVLPQLTRKHTVVVASVTDPDVLAATRERGDRAEVYRAAAAERALLDAARVAAAIRQSGAEVVTAAPADLPPALADRYLALKAAGRL